MVEQTIETPVIWDAIALIMTSLSWFTGLPTVTCTTFILYAILWRIDLISDTTLATSWHLMGFCWPFKVISYDKWRRNTRVHQCPKCSENIMPNSLMNSLSGLTVRFHSNFREFNWCCTLRPRENGRHFPDMFICVFWNENVSISIKISLKFVPKHPINNIPALIQIMDWHRPGDKPWSEPMIVSLLTHICVSRPQWIDMHSTQRT